mmetsp:Transcript_3384/g.6703  ORF Transcript_3384/g.6703 Transcript_3384/m.6703 type:complete len:208 (+) Transcript_3384:521-1144(+)
MTAPVSPLAVVIKSGVTSKYSAANGLPRRPNPVITSSKMRRMSCLSQMPRIFSRYPSGGTSTPALPATGSTMTAAMLFAPCSATMSSRLSARCAPHCGCPLENAACSRECVWPKWSTPGKSEALKAARLGAIPPTEIPPNPTPWYPRSRPIKRVLCPCPWLRWYASAIFSAVSTLVLPHMVKKALPSPRFFKSPWLVKASPHSKANS